MMVDAKAWLYMRERETGSLIYRMQLESTNLKLLERALKGLGSWTSVGESIKAPKEAKIIILQSEFKSAEHWKKFQRNTKLNLELSKG